MKYLLDTDICIYWLKGRNAVRDKINQVAQSEIAICVITVSELYFGAYNSSKVKQNLITADTFIRSLSIISLSIASSLLMGFAGVFGNKYDHNHISCVIGCIFSTPIES